MNAGTMRLNNPDPPPELKKEGNLGMLFQKIDSNHKTVIRGAGGTVSNSTGRS